MFISLSNNRMGREVVGPGGIWGRVQGVGSDHWGTGSQPRAGLRMGWPLKAKRSLFPDWQKGAAHSCSNYSGKIQNGVSAKCC